MNYITPLHERLLGSLNHISIDEETYAQCIAEEIERILNDSVMELSKGNGFKSPQSGFLNSEPKEPWMHSLCHHIHSCLLQSEPRLNEWVVRPKSQVQTKRKGLELELWGKLNDLEKGRWLHFFLRCYLEPTVFQVQYV